MYLFTFTGKVADPPSFKKEREFFQEVDAFRVFWGEPISHPERIGCGGCIRPNS
ncbi:hypothetical protein SLEP1_g53381 [Rubroshorea leprosula]|uniref:DUF1330 domain-containing protein n=1 Tax=Rubroshorea leprosula TaxID=152421 RepID=A0AAV5MA42_9ROSI|nr:hypothetical protein SLEP1_g53381 [Rubroshorea leprosula]